MIRALLVIWSLDPSGAGSAVVTPQPSWEACVEYAAATRRMYNCVRTEFGPELFEPIGATLAVNRCTVKAEGEAQQVWTCKGRAE